MRLPLVGSYNTRAGAQFAPDASSGVIGIGVIGIMIIGNTSFATEKDRRFVNCYVQASKDELSKTVTPYVVKRPGLAVSSTPAAGNIGSAIHVWVGQGGGGRLITAFGATDSTIYDDLTSLGSITGRATEITETTISGVPTLAISSSNNTGWYYPDAGALTKITDAEFPGNAGVTLAGTFAHIGGIAYIMGTDGYVYSSDINSLSEWTGSNKFATNSYPDKGVGCIRRGEYIVAFGTQSFEVLKNGAVPPPGSPLMRIPDATQKIGAVSANAMVNVRDVIYWAGSTREGDISIFRWSGGGAEVVSNPSIDSQLLLAGPGNITMTTGSFYGNTHIFIQAVNVAYAYCIDENCWWEVTSREPFRLRADSLSTGNAIVTYAISTATPSGKVYVIDPDSPVYTDDGFSYTAMVQTAASDFKTSKKKRFAHLELVADEELSPSIVHIVWTDDDYQSWNRDPRTVDLASDYRSITRLGSSRKRAFRLVHSANTSFRLQAIDLDADGLTA